MDNFLLGSDFFEHSIAHGLLSTLSIPLSSREAARRVLEGLSAE
jgi:hypothetical protein